jgi:hypothetical protein
MPEEDSGAGQLQHAEEVFDVILPAGNEPAGVVEPGEEAFDLPATARPAQRAPILGRGAAAAAMPGDHLDTVLLAQGVVEGVAVVAAIADQSRGEFAEEAGVEGRGDEVRLMR